jgi:membrane protease YdiL (CAAX protease family)
LLAAATEELMFRGVPLFRVRGAVASVLLTVVCSAAFAAQHSRNGVSNLGYKFIFGILFSFQFFVFGQLVPVIVGHVAGNWRILFASKQTLASSAKSQKLEHSALRM